MKFSHLLPFFNPDGEIIIEEDFNTLLIKFKSISTVINQDIPDFSKYVHKRDQLQIDTIFGDDEPIRYNTVTNDFTSYVRSYRQRISIIEEDETIQTVIHIYKNLSEKTLSVYSLNSFVKHFEALSLTNIIASFKKLNLDVSAVTFESQDENILLNTNSIQFVKIGVSKNILIPLEREQIITKQKSSGSFNLLEDYPFTPNDFELINVDCSDENSKKIKEIFDKLCALYSIGFIYDLVSVNKEVIDYKLNGYKIFKNQFKQADIPLASKEEYFSIYSWCYTSGNFNDKIGLSRNIISLHLEKENEILLKGSPFQAIQSGYKVYEKQNIKQYIEIRNKMADQILAFNEKANKIVETFASGFQKTALAFVSLFATIVISRVLAAHDYNNIFTWDATLIALIFLFVSLIYFFVCRWEVNEQQKRFKVSYDNMKVRNTDLLTKEDIERILNSDQEFNSDYKFIGNKKKYYSRTWISFIIIFAVLVTVSYFLGAKKINTSPIKENERLNEVQQQPPNSKEDTIKIDTAKRIVEPNSSKKK